MKKILVILLSLLVTACDKEDGYINGGGGDETPSYENYPEFSWDNVSLYQHLNNAEAYFTSDEIETIAKSQLVCIELQQAIRLNNGNYCIANTAYEAKRIKEINPKSKVLHYWHSHKDLGRYYQSEQFINEASDERVIYNVSNNPVYEVTGDGDYEYLFDMRNSATSKWWSNFVLLSCRNYPIIDGCFADGIGFYYGGCDATYGEGSSVGLWQAFVGALKRIEKFRTDNMITIVNGYEDTKPWNEDVLSYCDGAMIEHFCAMDRDTRNKIHIDIAKIQECARQKKIAVVKGWPRFTFVDVQNPQSEYNSLYKSNKEYLYELCREDIEFPLACYLIAAGEYSYFSYGWGFDNDSGNLLNYPEFYDYRLGKPKGDAVRDGDVYTREFEYASVAVDLTGYKPNSKGYMPDGETKVASITWFDKE